MRLCCGLLAMCVCVGWPSCADYVRARVPEREHLVRELADRTAVADGGRSGRSGSGAMRSCQAAAAAAACDRFTPQTNVFHACARQCTFTLAGCLAVVVVVASGVNDILHSSTDRRLRATG